MAKKAVRERLKKDIWADKEYYRQIEKRESYNHPGFLLGVKKAHSASTILDVGCGDGGKLSRLGKKGIKRFGCEISRQAVRVGRKKYPSLKLKVFDGKKLPFGKNKFDLVTCFFVLEHTDNPDELITDMVRVLKPGGALLLVAPNFGSPNRASPPYVGNRFKKLMMGFLADFSLSGKQLLWQRVTPTVASMKEFMPDYDTTVEPYLGSLRSFLRHRGLTIVKANSCWELELPSATILQRSFSQLGKRKVWPFHYWGPHLVVLAEKI